jgi:hypothetical protein
MIPAASYGQPAKENPHNDGVPARCVSERGARLKVGAAKKTP